MGDSSCWTCRFQKIGGGTFLGECQYFVSIGKPAKSIPGDRVDIGCKFWKERERRNDGEGNDHTGRQP